ncbi:MAG: efflux RND transporter periplasmic adaptor subunit [Cyclobacteriaceae bacterium]
MKRITTIVVVLILIGIVAFRLISNKEEIDAKSQMEDKTNMRVSVNTALVKSNITERNLSLVGTAIANQVIDIKSEVQGKIISLNVELGQQVRKGQVIARVDDKIQTLSVANAEQSLADAKQSLERYQNLYEGGAATKAQLDQYTLAYENAKNQLEQAGKQLSNSAITAPISGQIIQKPVETGSFASVGTSIATVVDVSKLKIQLNVPERDVYSLEVGDPVKITSPVFPEVMYEGEITFISPRGDESHSYPVEISLENNPEHTLKAGTYVDVAFNNKSQSPTLQIPREALVGSIKNAQVYIVNDESIAVLRDITIGAENGNYLEVLNGLQEGETVVSAGQINLTDSMKVQVIQ